MKTRSLFAWLKNTPCLLHMQTVMICHKTDHFHKCGWSKNSMPCLAGPFVRLKTFDECHGLSACGNIFLQGQNSVFLQIISLVGPNSGIRPGNEWFIFPLQ